MSSAAPLLASRLVTGWTAAVSITLCVVLARDGGDTRFYRFGPHADLLILGVRIDTGVKYGCLLVYCLINTCVRNLNHQVVSPWLTLAVQDETVDKSGLSHRHAYEVALFNCVYSWFDWFIYIHMLLAQVDMVLMEIGTDLVVTFFLTRFYLNTGPGRATSMHDGIDCAGTLPVAEAFDLGGQQPLLPPDLSSVKHSGGSTSQALLSLARASDTDE
jgi:hypothetical protein